MQVCTSLQADNCTSTSPLSFLQARCLPADQPTALKSKNFKTTLPVPVALFLKNVSRFVNDNESATNTEDNNNYYYTRLTAFFPGQPG